MGDDMDKGGRPRRKSASRKICVIGLCAIAVGLAIGLLIGRFALCPSQPEPEEKKEGVFLEGISEALILDGDPDIGRQLINAVDNKKLEEYLRYLSSEPHVAGRQRNYDLAIWIKKFWEDAGFDDVKLTPYDVLLSYPDPNNPNVVRVLNAAGGEEYRTPPKEKDLAGEDHPNALPPFNAYSPSGLIEGELVYVNYGRVEDYNWLENNASISVRGKIAISRYGKIFRGSKVDIAAAHGAIGLILFSDPKDYTWKEDGEDEVRVYPHTWWLPGSGSQRGTIYTGDGDPLTPGYPAIKSAFRYPEDSAKVGLPKIPAHPIGYDLAARFLREMAGRDAPASWQGGLNMTYRLGPALINPGWKIQMNISTSNSMEQIYNVIGVIRGAIEPDRYVLMGNHRDAWVYGALDPSSGTIVMMEAARVLAEKVKSGKWRPRRSIVFCSWGAEEYGLLGSNEWEEQYRKTLRARAVAYINVDIGMHGNYSLRGKSTPSLYRATYEAAKKIPNPNAEEVKAGRKTVYDTWLHSFPWKDENGTSLNIPIMSSLGSGSDYAPLLQGSGVTAVDFRYTFNTHKYKIGLYPLYHSVYETFHAVKDIMDKDFQYHAAVTKLNAELTRSLADSLIIPFNISDYSWVLNNYWKTFNEDYGIKMKAQLGDSVYGTLKTAVDLFATEVEDFNTRISQVNKNNPLAVRAINDQLMLLEKAFLDPSGLPDRPFKKHLLLAESSIDTYAGSSFPGLVDLLFEIEKSSDVNARWQQVKRHFSVVVFTIEAAAATLRDSVDFIPDS